MSIAITAPMAGKIGEVFVKVGEQVEESQTVLVFEAMKMENDIVAPEDGTVEKILVTTGQTVKAGDELVLLA